MSPYHRCIKRLFDVVVAASLLFALCWLVMLAVLVATIETRRFGLFRQVRIGKDRQAFAVFKVRTMRVVPGLTSTVTTRGDPRVTRFGAFMRTLKIDELPQLWNVLKGDMSIVGPRPDVPGFADELGSADSVVLSVKPGLTGPASLRFIDEERLLAASADPEVANRRIYAEKTRLNVAYALNYSLRTDFVLCLRTAQAICLAAAGAIRARYRRVPAVERLSRQSPQPGPFPT